MRLNNKTISIIIILLLFLLGFYFRLSLDGITPTHPGNLKAANAFYHVIAADHIADTGKIFSNPYWDSEGHDDIINRVSQHEAITIAPLIKLAGIEEWNISYLIVVLLSALSIPLMYILTKKIFKSEIIAIISAAILVLPLALDNWLYYMYIGIWLQSSVTPFLLLSLIFIIDVLKSPKIWEILALSITISAIFLLFPPVLIFILPFLLIILWRLLKEKEKGKLISYITIPLISILIFGPILLFGDAGIAATDEKLFEIGTPNYQSAPFAKGIEVIPIILTIFGAIGLILLFLNYKKYKKEIISIIYFGIIFYILPFLMHGHTGYYLLRMKGGFLIYLAAPIIAYGIYHIAINPLSKLSKNKNTKTILTVITIIILIITAIPAHIQLKEALSYEHITKEKYEVMLWVQENIPEGENILVLEGDYQLSGTYFKRNRFTLSQEELMEYFMGLTQGKDPLTINGFWSGYADWGRWSKRTGYFSFEKYEPLSKTQQLTNFNYIYFENLNPDIANINQQLASYLIEEHNYGVTYNQGISLILKKNEG